MLLEKEYDFSKSSLIWGIVPSILYSIVYLIMVFGVGTWTDIYHIKDVCKAIGNVAFFLVYLLLIGTNILIGFADYKINRQFIRKTNKKVLLVR